MRALFKKAAIITLLILCLCALLSLNCYAANTEAPTVTINGKTLTSENPYYKNDGTYGTAEDYNAKFDAQNGVLTLKNLDIETYRNDGIDAEGTLTLVLEGTNSIGITCHINDNKVYYYGIDADTLTIRGSGSLTVPYVQNSYNRQATCGISAQTLTIESGTVNIDNAYSSAIAVSSCNITGGTVCVFGGGTGISSKSMYVSGGTVKAFGHEYGLQLNTSLHVSGGAVETFINNASSMPETGIYAPVCNISGGTVNAVGKNKCISSYNGFYLSGGTVIADSTGSSTSDDQLGISAGSICITGGQLTITSARGAFSTAPCFSSCCTFNLKQGSSAETAEKINISSLNSSSPYFFCKSESEKHTVTVIDAVEPTCTADGSTAGTQCVTCNLYLDAPAARSRISHTYSEKNTDTQYRKSAATCKASAVYYYACTCGAFSTYSSGTYIHGDPLPHTPEVLSATTPSCNATGLTEGSRCSVCKTVLSKQETVPATGHTLTVTKWIWNDDLTEATAVLNCQDCSHSENRTATVTIEETTAPTLTTVGQKTHTADLTVGETQCTDVRYSEIPVLIPHSHNVCADSSCSDGHEELIWQPWESTTSLPETAGNYYLVNDVTLNDTYALSNYGTTLEIRLCLNGKSVIMEQNSPIPSVIEVSNDVALTVTDCSTVVSFGNLDDETGRWTPSIVSGTCNLTGGVITGGSYGISCRNNSVTHIYGGNLAGNFRGLYIYGGTVNLHGGSISHNVSAYACGGVEINGGTFNMTGGSITHNRYSATTGLLIGAGGVYVSSGVFNMSGGVIANNHTTEKGGGVRVNSGGHFYMTGGSIANNSAAKNGGGVYVHDATARVYLADAPVIQGNTVESKPNNLHFYQVARKATVTAPLAAGASIGISMEKPGVFTSGWTEQMGDSEIFGFFSDAGDSLPVALDPCGELRLGVHEHQWSSWSVDTAPTEETAGKLVRSCSADLAHEETLDLPALNETDYTCAVTKAPTLTETGTKTYTYKEPQTEQEFSFSAELPATGQALIDEVVITRDPDTGAVTMTGVPEGVTVILALYNGNQMTAVQIRTGETVTFSNPGSGVLKVFFVNSNWIPVSQPKTIS